MNERKTIFLAIGVLVVAMVVSNIGIPLSGYEVMDSQSRIEIKPNPVERNQIIEATVFPGPRGVKNEWMWMERNGAKMQGTLKKICPEMKEAVCYQTSTVKYLVGTNDNSWPSDVIYTVKVEENSNVRSAGGIKQDVYATADFSII